jgi:hypothetical protein
MRTQREIESEIDLVASRLRKMRSKPARERSPLERVLVRIDHLQLQNLRLELKGGWRI